LAENDNEPQGPRVSEIADTIQGEVRPAPVIESPVDIHSFALTVITVLLVLAALYLARPVLIPLAFAILTSYALNPLVSSLEHWRIPRAAAATLVLTAVVGATGWLAYSMTDDVTAVAQQMPGAADKLRQTVREMRRSGESGPVGQVQEAAKTLESAAAEAAGQAPAGAASRQTPAREVIDIDSWIVTSSLGMVAVVTQAVVVFFLALYLLASGDLFRRKLVRIVSDKLSQKKITVQILDEIDRQIAAFLLVRLGVTVLVAVFTWLPLQAIGLRQAALWGIVAGVLNIIPYFGPVIVAIVVFAVAFVQFETLGMAAAASGITVAITSLEGYLLTPWVTSKAGQMNAVAIFIGLLFWGWIWGLAGLLLAVPLMLVLKAVCDRVEELKPVGELLGE
jgi:predicted PurR-regulated permease PerM